MKKYIIERNLPIAGGLRRERLRAKTGSAQALLELEVNILWLESFVAEDKTFSVYLADNEAVIRRHAELSGFPAGKISELDTMSAAAIDTAIDHVH